MDEYYSHFSPNRKKRTMLHIAAGLGFLFVAVLSIYANTSTSRPQLNEMEFKKFISNYSKNYASHEEFEKKFDTFMKNLKMIRDHNLKGEDWVLGINSFADMSAEEFKSYYLPNKFPSPNSIASKTEGRFKNMLDIPASVNWVTKGAVTPVQSQGNCGSHWAFSASGAIEGMWFIAGNPLVQVSTQQILDCSSKQGNHGCDGGLMNYAFEYVMNNTGVTSDAVYPYIGDKSDGCWDNVTNLTSVAHITNYTNVTPDSSQALLAAIAQQPVSVAVEADQIIWQFYFGGVVSRNCGTLLDHGALAVGYDLEATPPYYLVKNSWGKDWGESGYIRIAVTDGKGVCGIQIEPSYPYLTTSG